MQNLQDSFESIQFTPGQSSLYTSTPSKKTKGKKFVRPICDTCEICQKAYRCHRSYLKHMRDHKLKEIASSYPNVQQIMEHLQLNIPTAMRKLESYPLCGPYKSAYKGLITGVLQADFGTQKELAKFFESVHDAMTTSLHSSKFLLPSALIIVLQKNVEVLLSHVDYRKLLNGLIQECLPCDSTVVNFFVADYALSLVQEILSFICSSLRLANRGSVLIIDKSIELDIEDKEAIHYISGSVVHGFHAKSRRFPDNPTWKKIGQVILDKLLESDLIPGPPEDVKGWTKAQNRGKLFFVSGVMFDFFCGVTEILSKDESVKGVNHDKVLEGVCSSGLLLLFDEAIGESFEEELAFNVMSGMVRSFSQTFGVGKAKKIMNAARKKAEASVPLRHKVAPR